MIETPKNKREMKEYRVKVYDDRTEWRLNGQLHREVGPAIWSNGYKAWYLNGQLHREVGPAIWSDGYKAWWFNGQLHREDGPAIERPDGNNEWWVNGQPRHADNSAHDKVDGDKARYLNDQELTEAEFNNRTNAYAGTVIEIDGKKYKLTEV